MSNLLSLFPLADIAYPPNDLLRGTSDNQFLEGLVSLLMIVVPLLLLAVLAVVVIVVTVRKKNAANSSQPPVTASYPTERP